MADNVTLNTGTGGDVIAADDVGGAKYQYVKLAWGPDNTVNLADAAVGKALPVAPVGGGVLTLQASQTSGVVNATNSRTTTTGFDTFVDLAILLNITNGGAATGVLNLYLQDSLDGGTTWDDVVAFNPFTFGAAVVTQRFIISGRVASSGVQGNAAQQEALAAGSVRFGPWGDRLRVREKVSGVAGSPTGVTYTITAVAKR